MNPHDKTLPLFGYDIVPTGKGGEWTVRARKPDAHLMRPTMRVSRAAQIADVSSQTIYVAIIAGELEADPITPTHKRVFADALYAWIKARQGEDYWTPERRAAWQAATAKHHGSAIKKKSRAKARGRAGRPQK
jgi:hypothetical protein